MDTDKITQERLGSWRERLREAHATPLVLIGVGHEHKSGELVLCVPEGVDDRLLEGSLRFALAALAGGQMPQKHGESTTWEPRRN